MFEFVIQVNCTFDESYCGWRKILTSPNDQIGWCRTRSGNQSQRTGPSQDHTGNQNILMTMWGILTPKLVDWEERLSYHILTDQASLRTRKRCHWGFNVRGSVLNKVEFKCSLTEVKC